MRAAVETPEEIPRGGRQDPQEFREQKAEGAEMISEELGFRINRTFEKAVSGEQKIQETSEVQPDDVERDRTGKPSRDST